MEPNEDLRKKILEDLWLEIYNTPLQWSIYLAKLDTPLGEYHRERIKAFKKFLRENIKGPIDKESSNDAT